MVLVDFKGGATFAGMTDLPHVSAVITNLAQELTLVDRMQDALSGRWCVGRSCCARPGTSRRPRLRGPPCGDPAGPAPLPVALPRRRRVLRDALGQAGVHRPVRGDRPARLLARPAPARLAAAGGPPARPGVAPVPTAWGCGRSAPPSRAPCSASRTPTSCPPTRAWATSSRTRRPCCGSGGVRLRPAVGGGSACVATRVGTCRGILPFTISEVVSSTRSRARRARAGPRRPPGDDRRPGVPARHRRAAHDRPGAGRAPGLAAAARRAGHPWTR